MTNRQNIIGWIEGIPHCGTSIPIFDVYTPTVSYAPTTALKTIRHGSQTGTDENIQWVSGYCMTSIPIVKGYDYTPQPLESRDIPNQSDGWFSMGFCGTSFPAEKVS